MFQLQCATRIMSVSIYPTLNMSIAMCQYQCVSIDVSVSMHQFQCMNLNVSISAVSGTLLLDHCIISIFNGQS